MKNVAETELGKVKVIPYGQNPPQGWNVLTLEEGKKIKKQLIPLVGQWGIVAFETGKFDGSGYGNKIHETFGGECGEKFIINRGNNKTEPAVVQHKIEKDAAYQNFISSRQKVDTPLGLVVKTGLNDPLPPQFRKLTAGEGTEVKGQINRILQAWSIVAFEDGKIDGSGYGNKIHFTYSNECGEVFVIESPPVETFFVKEYTPF